MKKLMFALIAVIAVAAVVFLPTVTVAEEANPRATSSDVYNFVEEMCDLQKLGIGSVRSFLEYKFSEALGGVKVEEQSFVVTVEGYANGYVNLEAKLSAAGSDKQIIIGAHYDSMGEGAGDNACGVAALWRTMQLLATYQGKLPFNVVFVAFDGEEDGLLGSEYYVQQMSQAERDSTLVMFNIDTIATGDNLYVQCENKSTDLAKLILNSAKDLQEPLKEKPHAKGVSGTMFDVYGYGYYELVQSSDHTPFRLQGIPIAFFFSGIFSFAGGYAENSDPTKAVMNTATDTFANLTQKHPNFEARIETVAQTVLKTVTSQDFLKVGENARSQLVNLNFWYTAWWPIIVVLVIAIAAAVAAIFYHRKLQKNAILGESEIKTQTIFAKPDAEDIFSYKSDDVDDIFTFKK